jgi:3-hydroxyisobutyrate dehydrogenase-like beta-hydroxyacid dehydrogenase
LLDEMSANSTSVGFIGLGKMGLPMAKNLLKMHSVRALDPCAHKVPPQLVLVRKLDDLLECNPIILMLPDHRAVENVLVHNKLLNKLPSRATILDCSTVSPKFSRLVSSKAFECSLVYIDAPVSGGTTLGSQAI